MAQKRTSTANTRPARRSHRRPSRRVARLLSARADSRDGRVDRGGVHPGLSVSHVRGRSLRHPHRLDGPHADGRPQGPVLPQCGFRYAGRRQRRRRADGRSRWVARRAGPVVDATCPMCRYTANVDPRPRQRASDLRRRSDPGQQVRLRIRRSPAVGRDRSSRIPARPDQFHQAAASGCPNETMRIWHGDLYVKPAGERRIHLTHRAAERTAGHGPDRLRQRLCRRRHDRQAGWPLRWQPWPAPALPPKGELEERRRRAIVYASSRRRRRRSGCAIATSSPRSTTGGLLQQGPTASRLPRLKPLLDHRFLRLQHQRRPRRSARPAADAGHCIGSAT